MNFRGIKRTFGSGGWIIVEWMALFHERKECEKATQTDSFCNRRRKKGTKIFNFTSLAPFEENKILIALK